MHAQPIATALPSQASTALTIPTVKRSIRKTRSTWPDAVTRARIIDNLRRRAGSLRDEIADMQAISRQLNESEENELRLMKIQFARYCSALIGLHSEAKLNPAC